MAHSYLGLELLHYGSIRLLVLVQKLGYTVQFQAVAANARGMSCMLVALGSTGSVNKLAEGVEEGKVSHSLEEVN